MSNPLMLLFADAHLRDRHGDEQFALKQIIDAAIAERVETVISAGDLIDRQSNRAAVIQALMRQIDRLAENDISFFYILGQHDWDEPGMPECHHWPQHLDKGDILIGGRWSVYGLDYRTSDDLHAELADVPNPCDLLITHQTWGDWMGSIACPQADFAHVPAHVHRLFSGDLHKQIIETNLNAGGVPMITVSPGATCMQTFAEPPDHYYVLFFDDGTFERRELRSRLFLDTPLIVSEADLEAVLGTLDSQLDRVAEELDDLPEDLRRPRLRCQFSYQIPETVRRLTRAVAGRALLAFYERGPQQLEISGESAALVSVPGVLATPLGLLSEEVDRAAEPEAFALLERLLSRPQDATETFARWKSEYLAADRQVTNERV